FKTLGEQEPPLERLAMSFGVLGFVFIVIYAVVDGFGSPVLGRLYVSGNEMHKSAAEVVFHWMDKWRDEGMKTLAYFFISLWLLLNAWVLLRGGPFGSAFAWLTLLFGATMLLMAVASVALIFRRQLPADKGWLGAINLLVLQVVWGVWLGVELWTAKT
ncbi:MAG: hypothetical protein LC737_04675, partial [Chloroflexi bacterium]|nr:hypothetical protein [Chloroflexota bacterium]